MIKFLLIFLIFSPFFITIIFSCTAFICQPYSNSASITYQVEPSPSLTYNTNISRVSGQYPSASSLAGNLETIAKTVINSLATQMNPIAPSLSTSTVTVSRIGLLDAIIIPQICPDNNQRTIAPTGSYFVQNNKIMERLQPENCTNGVVQPVLSSPPISTLVFNINFKIHTGQTLCYSHWTTLADAIKTKIVSETGSIFLGSGVIAANTAN